MTVVIDDCVYFLERWPDGTYNLDATLTLTELGGSVPGFGDRITLVIQEAGPAMMEVVGRYFVHQISEVTDDEWYAWFVIVKDVDLDEAVDLFEAISKVYKENVVERPRRPTPAPAPRQTIPAHEERDELDKWVRKSAELDKHRPVHKLSDRQMRVLRYMADHPECSTADVIPNAGEKTMEALARVGCLRQGGTDYTGRREWFVTDEGRAEVKRADTWNNWKF